MVIADSSRAPLDIEVITAKVLDFDNDAPEILRDSEYDVYHVILEPARFSVLQAFINKELSDTEKQWEDLSLQLEEIMNG